jgi:hypothetical protein
MENVSRSVLNVFPERLPKHINRLPRHVNIPLDIINVPWTNVNGTCLKKHHTGLSLQNHTKRHDWKIAGHNNMLS